MPKNNLAIFAGTLLVTTDNFLLSPFDNGPFVDLTPKGGSVEDRLDRHPVSVLGRMGERFIGDGRKVASLLAEKIVSQDTVAERAFAAYEANPHASAFDNWIRAEREVLGA